MEFELIQKKKENNIRNLKLNYIDGYDYDKQKLASYIKIIKGGLKHVELAKYVGCNASAISRAINCRNRGTISLEFIAGLAAVSECEGLTITLEDLATANGMVKSSDFKELNNVNIDSESNYKSRAVYFIRQKYSPEYYKYDENNDFFDIILKNDFKKIAVKFVNVNSYMTQLRIDSVKNIISYVLAYFYLENIKKESTNESILFFNQKECYEIASSVLEKFDMQNKITVILVNKFGSQFIEEKKFEK